MRYTEYSDLKAKKVASLMVANVPDVSEVIDPDTDEVLVKGTTKKQVTLCTKCFDNTGTEIDPNEEVLNIQRVDQTLADLVAQKAALNAQIDSVSELKADLEAALAGA